MSKPNKLILRSPIFRMSYASVVAPRPVVVEGKPKGDPIFSNEMLFTPENLTKFKVRRDDEWKEINVKSAMVEVARARFPDLDLKAAIAAEAFSWPLKDGNKVAAEMVAKKKKGDAYEGMMVIPAKSGQDYPPQLFVVDGGKYVELSRGSEEDMRKARDLFVSGYYAKGSLNVVADTSGKNKYVTFYMNAILFVKKGERIGGVSAEDRFGGVDGGVSDYDPTEGLDDEIPF